MTTPANIIRGGVVFVLLIVHQICAFQVSDNHRSKTNDLNLYRNPRAEKLRSLMNESVDPCFDFYEFACGNWKTNYPATEGTPITSPMLDLEDTINKQLQVILEEENRPSDGQVIRNVKNFYSSCKESGIVTQSIKPAFTDFINKNSGMPAVQPQWDERNYNWITQVGNLRRQFGMDIMIGVNIKPDMKNRQYGQIYIGEASTLLPRHICKEGDYKNNRYDELKTEITNNMAYWFDMDKTEGAEFASSLLKFETFLCSKMSEEVGPDVFPNITKMTLNDLNSIYPSIMFADFITIVFGQHLNQLINVQDRGYFDHLAQVIEQTQKKQIANYIMYRALNTISFPEEYNTEKRASLCVEECVKHYPKAVGAMFNAKHSSSRTEQEEEVKQILIELIEAFRTDIESQLWIEEYTRKQSLYKINKMEVKFMSYYPDVLLKRYESVIIEKNSFWKNVLNLLGLEQKYEKKKLNPNSNVKPTVGKEVESFNINAAYSPMENKIAMPFGLLQPPVYHATAPNAFKFGILGFFIARELIHGFDENGWIFDDVSAMRLWWDLNSTLQYKERAACFRDQYVSYAGSNSDFSPLELDENIREIIADNGALNISFNAYLEWLEKTTDQNILYDETLSDVDYTNTQLFFISFAQNFCTATYTQEEPTGLFPWDTPNYLEKFKVNGVLWNMKEFSREFNCLPGSEMNPGNKCSIF